MLKLKHLHFGILQVRLLSDLGEGFELALDSLLGARKLKTPYLSIREILSSALYEKTVKLLFFLLFSFTWLWQADIFIYFSKQGLIRPASADRSERRIKEAGHSVFLTWNWPQIDSTWIILPSSHLLMWVLFPSMIIDNGFISWEIIHMDFQILDILWFPTKLLRFFLREIVTPAICIVNMSISIPTL